jgi:hypothetical protein
MTSAASPQLFLVANSIFPYGYDAVKVLALPNGAIYRARFDQKFVSEQIKKDFPRLRGQKGHYCFRDYETGCIIPLRSIVIQEVSLIGSVYYIRYSVEMIYDFPQDRVRLEKQLSDFSQSIRNGTSFTEDEPGKDLKPLFHEQRKGRIFRRC